MDFADLAVKGKISATAIKYIYRYPKTSSTVISTVKASELSKLHLSVTQVIRIVICNVV